MRSQAPKPKPERIAAAIRHLESVAAVIRERRAGAKVIPFPAHRSRLYEPSN